MRSLTNVYKLPLSRSHSPIAKSSYTYIQISRKTSQKNLAKKPQTYSFFFDILPLFIIFFSLPFYIRDDQFPKNSGCSIKECTINLLYEDVLSISINKLISY